MSNLPIQKETKLEIIHKHQIARIMLLADLLLTSAYVMNSLPSCSGISFFYNFTFCELQNIDKVIGVYLSLKFLFAAALSAIAVCTFSPGEKIPLFWYVSALTLFLAGLDQMFLSQVFSSSHHMILISDKNRGLLKAF